jgi:hypothetical protein
MTESFDKKEAQVAIRRLDKAWDELAEAKVTLRYAGVPPEILSTVDRTIGNVAGCIALVRDQIEAHD